MVEKKVDKKLDDVQKNEPRINIVLSEDDKDTQPVQVGVNGRMYVIKRGVRVSVPKAVVEVLQHAVKTVYPSGDLNSPREVLQYPFQIV